MVTQNFIVGYIRGSHGYEGVCKVESASGDYNHILELKEVELRHKVSDNQADFEKKTFKIESVSPGANVVYVKFAGINSSEEVRKYNGWGLVVPRKYAKPLKKDEWYIEDLKNCSLIYENYELNHNSKKTDVVPVESATLTKNSKNNFEVVGTITDVLEGGAGYLLEVSLSENCTCIEDFVKYTSSGKLRTVLVPFVNEHIGKIDVKSGTVQLMHLWILE